MPRGPGILSQGYITFSPSPLCPWLSSTTDKLQTECISVRKDCKQTRGCFRRCIPVEGRRLSQCPSPSLGSRFRCCARLFPGRMVQCNVYTRGRVRGKTEKEEIYPYPPGVWMLEVLALVLPVCMFLGFKGRHVGESLPCVQWTAGP